MAETLDRIDRVNPAINAIVALRDRDTLLAEAATAPPGPLQGLPVAIKVASADVVHRTERGLVVTGLTSTAEVAAAAADLERRMGGPSSVLVQPMVSGVEMALGAVRDPVMGPLIMVAPGGIGTDLADDRAFLLPPFGAGEFVRVLRRLRSWPLLDGYRGAARVDVDAFARAAADLGRLVVDVPEIAELDLNPVLVAETGIHLVDVKMRLAPADTLDEPRQLGRT